MKITYSNYPAEKSKIDFKKLPAAITAIVPNLSSLDDYYEMYNDDASISQAFNKVLDAINKTSFVDSHIIVASMPKYSFTDISYSNYPELKSKIDFKKLPESITAIVPNLSSLDDYYEMYKDDDTIAKAFDKVIAAVNKYGIVAETKKATNTTVPFTEGQGSKMAVYMEQVFKYLDDEHGISRGDAQGIIMMPGYKKLIQDNFEGKLNAADTAEQIVRKSTPADDKPSTHIYKLGDKYRSDFDFEGLFKMALTSTIDWGIYKLSQLFNSFEDNNYHTTAGPLREAIRSLEKVDRNDADTHMKRKDLREANEKLSEFHAIVRHELGMEPAVKEAIKTLKSEKDKPAKDQATKKIKLKSIKISGTEGYTKLTDKIQAIEYKTWDSANKAMRNLAIQDDKDTISDFGYKSKAIVTFEDGEDYEARLYLSPREDNPFTTTNMIGKHILEFLTWEIEHNSKDKAELVEFLDKYDLGVIKDDNTKLNPAKKEKARKLKFKVGDFVQKINNHNLQGTITKAELSVHDDLEQTYNIDTVNGPSEYWYEREIEKAKKPKKVKPVDPDLILSPMMPEDVKLLARIKNLIAKPKKVDDFANVHKAIEKADAERRITKDGIFAKEINYALKWIEKCYAYLVKENKTSEKFDMEDKTMLASIVKHSTGYAVMAAVEIIKKYISIQNKPDKPSAQKLYDRILAYEASGSKSEHYAGKLSEIKSELKSYLNSDKPKLNLSNTALSGIVNDGLGCACTLSQLGYMDEKVDNFKRDLDIPVPFRRNTSSSSSLEGLSGADDFMDIGDSEVINFMDDDSNATPVNKYNGGTPLNQVKSTTNTFRLPGEIGKFIGNIALDRYAMVIKGDPGAGKSRLSLMIANAFLARFNRVDYFSFEMSPSNPEIKKNYFDKYVAPDRQAKLITHEEGNIEKVRQVAENSRVVIIDSWGKLGCRSEEYGNLRKQYPNTAFIVIFQSTTSGEARGGSTSAFDCDELIHITTTPEGYKKTFAQKTKSRYANTDDQFNLFEQKVL